MRHAIIFDLDNTLIECGQHYLDAQNEFVKQTSLRTGLDATLVTKILQHIDTECSALPDGFSRHRFPRSFRAAAFALDAVVGRADIATHAYAERMYRLADSVFSAEYPLYPGVREVLQQYQQGGWGLLLVTKGDTIVQNWKIDKHDLRQYFEGVHIVLRKTPELYRELAERYDVDPAGSWVVGDSLRDDIGPGTAAGFRTVEVRTATGRWGYEDQTHTATAWVQGLVDLHKHIPVTDTPAKLKRKLKAVHA